jgi:hypothetical protein
MAQQNQIREEEASKHPYVGAVEPLASLKSGAQVYACMCRHSNFRTKTRENPVTTWAAACKLHLHSR